MKRRIQFFAVLLSAGAIILTAGLVTWLTYHSDQTRMKADIKQETVYIASAVEAIGSDYLTALPQSSSYHRITWVDKNGVVIFDSYTDESGLENHRDRPEIEEAYESGSGEITRASDTLSKKTYYYALRLEDGSVLRLANTTDSVFKAFYEILPMVLIIIVLVFVAVMLASHFYIKRIVKPINDIDLDHPEENDVYSELSPLLYRMFKQNQMIENRTKELYERQREFTVLTENMREGLLLLDSEGTVLYFNKSAQEYTEHDIVEGQSVFALNRSESFQKLLHSALTGEESDDIFFARGKSIQVLANPVITDNEIRGIVTLLIDVTERLERERLRREFTANVSHEMKTPLTTISGYAEIISNGVAKTEDIPGFAENIYEEAQQLLALVTDLMTLSKLDEKRNELIKQEIDLYKLLEKAIERLRNMPDEHGISILLRGNHPKVVGYETVLEDAFLNLLDNAVKYNRENGEVRVEITERGDAAICEISDTGIGIPPEDIERVFERFYRVDKSRSSQVAGTGLGLAIVKHALELHDGEITLKSSEEGTTVTVVLKRYS